MARLEALRAGAFIGGLAPDGPAKVVHVEWFGDQAVKVTYEDAAGAVGNRLVYRNEEAALNVAEAGLPWSFDGGCARHFLLMTATPHNGYSPVCCGGLIEARRVAGMLDKFFCPAPRACSRRYNSGHGQADRPTGRIRGDH